MTCIVGLLKDNRIWVGGDSAASTNYLIQQRADEKVFINNNCIIGVSGSPRMGQLLRYAFIPPKLHSEDNLMSYMVNDFINGIRDTFKNAGFLEKVNEVESLGNSYFIVGIKNKLFTIFSDYQIAEHSLPFVSIGSGQEYALGSLFSIIELEVSPEEKIKKALDAANAFNPFVKSPYIILSIESS
jgi:ATP-dependent protease HslVU (ClpYQ) peptidase subunit